MRGTNHLCNEKQFIKVSIQYICMYNNYNNNIIIKVNKHFDSFLHKCLQTNSLECFVELISFLVIRYVIIRLLILIHNVHACGE